MLGQFKNGRMAKCYPSFMPFMSVFFGLPWWILSDALAAQVGGLGMAPGANIGDECAVFEATHGTAPKYAGLDKVNPGSLILSGAMMLTHLGWDEAAEAVRKAVAAAIVAGRVTYDLARQIDGATEVSCSAFAEAIVGEMG